MGTPGTSSKRKGKASKARLSLRLYVAGNAPNSLRAIANATKICNEHYAAAHDLEIVDLLAHPRRALADSIIVTPTLLKLWPLPEQRVIGNLDDTGKVLMVLAGK
jgi:circadian clock protein KaiB